MQRWPKFKLLMWKNWKLQLRRPISFVVEIAIPLLILASLLLLRNNLDIVHNANRVNPDETLDPESRKIYYLSAYSPTTSDFVNAVMKDFKIEGKRNARELEDFMKNSSTFGCVQFDDNIPGNIEQLPATINITIRFPPEWYESQNLDSIFPGFNLDPGFGLGTLGGSAKINIVMYQLSKKIFELRNSTRFPNIVTKGFPLIDYDADTMIIGFGQMIMLPILFITAFTYNFTCAVKSLALEKEKQLKESMKIMGLPTSLHWIAWFVQMISTLFVVVVVITIGLKFPLNDHKIIEYGDVTLLFLFLVLFITSLVTFSFAISGLFSKANKASAIGGIVWILSMVPYIIVRSGSYSETEPFTKYVTSLLGGSALGYGIDIILLLETRKIGIQWSNLFDVYPEMKISFGSMLVMLLLDIFIYLAIALYIEQVFPGEYGVSQKWYFLFTPEFWTKNKEHSIVDGFVGKSSEDFEDEPSNCKAGISIQNLTKRFGSNDAVKSISMNLYENQITVLLGHNGAGKTTTMSMLTGMITPTSGTAFINDFDIRTQIMRVRNSMGLCLQHNVLFDDLTVREHLYFFSKLKGCEGPEVDLEVVKFLKLLDLEDKANEKSAALSGGMKRKLSVGIALCGRSKVIMLDEPTAGMDPSARRFIWEFLQKEKKGRTILLTTHFMDEADLLGDRIGIMSGGELKCCGSSFFLKKRYGTGYHLVIDQSPECQPQNITQLLRKYIPNIDIESCAGTELVYLLPQEYVSHFPTMLSELENFSGRLGVRSFGISLTDLEEVFMKVGTNETGKYANQKNNNTENHVSLNIRSTSLVTALPLIMNQIRAIILKKVWTFFGSLGLMTIQTVLPVLFLIWTVLSSNYNGLKTYNSRSYTLSDYDDPIVLIENSSEHYQNYLKMLEVDNYNYELTSNISERILKLEKNDEEAARRSYIIGSSFGDKSIAWYSSIPFHAAPLSLQLLINSYLPDYRLNFINHPLPPRESKNQIFTANILQTGVVELVLTLATAFIGTFYILFCIRERVSQAKHLQFISGIDVFVFWFFSFVCDLLTYMISIIVLLIAFAILQPQGMNNMENFSILCLLLFLYGVNIIPFIYVLARLFTIPSTGFSRVLIITFFTGIPTLSVIKIWEAFDKGVGAKVADKILQFIPSYNFIKNSDKLFQRYIEQMNIDRCKEYHFSDKCETNQESIFALSEDGITIGIIIMICSSILMFIILFLIDCNILRKLLNKFSFIKSIEPTFFYQDQDVSEEANIVHQKPLNELQNQNILVLKDLVKRFKRLTAVDGLNLTVKKSECFGLLGVNGAGKTTTFKMMTGGETISFGDGWIKGHSIKNEMNMVQRFIGYCPQFDALLDDLTARQTLKIFSLIRGVPKEDCDLLAEKLAKDFDFSQHLDKKVKELSGGNKRKLSTTIALIGDAPVIFLDEPTTGMDPGTKRHLWNRLSEVRASGKSIILTSHSMEECEALCTRLAIMVNGQFQCLGSIQHLKNKFAQGYTITLKIRKVATQANPDTTSIENYIFTHFPLAQLKEKHQELLTFFVRDSSVKWSVVFGILESTKRQLNVEDYAVKQTSLEQIFLSFTQKQHEIDGKKKKGKRRFLCV